MICSLYNLLPPQCSKCSLYVCSSMLNMLIACMQFNILILWVLLYFQQARCSVLNMLIVCVLLNAQYAHFLCAAQCSICSFHVCCSMFITHCTYAAQCSICSLHICSPLLNMLIKCVLLNAQYAHCTYTARYAHCM